MKPAPFAYHDPRTLDDLVGILGRVENAKLLAGGQSLMPMLNMRYVIPDHVVDLNRIPELSHMAESDGRLEIGATVRQATLERSALIAARCPVMLEALGCVGHFQTRNRGTIGGSLSHLDPAAELPGIAALYDATLHVAGPNGRREVAFADWGLGYMTPNLEPDEALIGVSLTPWNEPHGAAFVEFARRHGDFAIVGVACLAALDGAGRVRRAAISLVGVDVKPVRLSEAEAALAGVVPSAEVFAEVAAAARRLDCLSDTHVSAAYRQRLAATLTRRALALALARAIGGLDV